MPSRTLLIRADANAEIGTGHIMRCIAVAQAWQKIGGRVIFALTTGAEELAGRICSEGAEVVRIQAAIGSLEDAAQTSELRVKCKAEWMVLDGYRFSTDYLHSMESATSKLLWVADGEGIEGVQCDIILNPGPDVSEHTFQRGERHTEFLLGPRYALLRREFLEFPIQRLDVVKRAKQLLITLGGGDFHNVTLQVIEALQAINGQTLDVTVVIGPSNLHRSSLTAAAQQSVHSVKLLANPDNMPELMAHAELAITAGGGTCYELAFMKVPMFLITTAGNQERAVTAFGSSGAAFVAGWFGSLDRIRLSGSIKEIIGNRTLRRELAGKAKQMVDGKGAERVVDKMLAIDGHRRGETL